MEGAQGNPCLCSHPHDKDTTATDMAAATHTRRLAQTHQGRIASHVSESVTGAGVSRLHLGLFTLP